jgi:hypothetical protein
LNLYSLAKEHPAAERLIGIRAGKDASGLWPLTPCFKK